MSAIAASHRPWINLKDREYAWHYSASTLLARANKMRGGDFNARLSSSAATWPALRMCPVLRGSVVSLDRRDDKTCVRADSVPHSPTATADF
ncbi:MAG: hypothetical protein C5B58_08635 [Acidobacteria bacterium]|nr:MAG: hypothetical protein C5B58_08635 [Acidobacteriota bacterium]